MFDWGEERTVSLHRGQLVWYCLALTVERPETLGKQKVLEESETNGKRVSTVTDNYLSKKDILLAVSKRYHFKYFSFLFSVIYYYRIVSSLQFNSKFAKSMRIVKFYNTPSLLCCQYNI